MAALKRIKQELGQAKQRSEAELGGLKQATQAYRSLGREFQDLVAQYAQIKENLENKKWALAEFTQNVSLAGLDHEGES